jgi:hypothetical protein
MKNTSLFLVASLVAVAAQAGPMRCTPGFQDSSCQGVLLNPPQTPPTCSNAAGWTTTSPAVWQGSHYSAPGCTYTPPPACPANYTMTSAPTWNGSSWSAPVCTPTTPPTPLKLSAGEAAQYGYFTPKLSAAGSQTFQVRTDGTWSLARSGFSGVGLMQTGSPTSGTWNTDSTQAYEYTITMVNHMGIGNYSPTASTATWTNMTNLSFTSSTPGGGVPEEEALWKLNIRQKGTTSPVLTFNIDLDTANGD